MARQCNGSSQTLQSASALSLSAYNTLTVAYWAHLDVIDATFHIFTSYGAGAGGPAFFCYAFDPFSTTAPLTSVINATNSLDASQKKDVQLTTGAWIHHVQTYDLTLNESGAGQRKCIAWYMNGAATTLISASAGYTGTGDTFGDKILYLMSFDAASGFTQAGVAEVAIWSGILSGATIADMYNGGGGGNGKSAAFYPTNLRYYWKILGTDSPEPENSAGIALTLIGAPTSLTHPAIDYPAAAATTLTSSITKRFL
jgi:hypothetical protein